MPGLTRVLGLYLLCKEPSGSKYSDILNALITGTCGVRVPLGRDLSATTVDVLYKVKCAIYAALFLWSTENHKHRDQPAVEARQSTDQHLGTWRRLAPGPTAASVVSTAVGRLAALGRLRGYSMRDAGK